MRFKIKNTSRRCNKIMCHKNLCIKVRIKRKEIDHLKVQARIADYVNARGIKRSFIAEKTGIALSRVSAILNNNTELRADELEDICNALGADPNSFVKIVKIE